MHYRTEDLLKIRDGEPIDAALRERLVADPDGAARLQTLERVREGLRALPQLEPPPAAWARIAAESRGSRSARPRFGLRIAVALGVAAVLAVAAVAFLLHPADSGPAAAGGETARTGSPLPTDRPRGGDSYAALLAESAQLERALARMHAETRVTNAGTAGTIAGLEDTVALLDEQLTYAAAGKLDTREREALWRERVDVMNALVQVRYAQAQRPAFSR